MRDGDGGGGSGGGSGDGDGDKGAPDPGHARQWVVCGGGEDDLRGRVFPNAAAVILLEEVHARGGGASQ